MEVFGLQTFGLDEIAIPIEVDWMLAIIKHGEAMTSRPTLHL
jgi:hypothetical protein